MVVGPLQWTSLICTAFLLMLCITGLPLIFKDEIDHLLHEEVEAAEVPAGTPKADLDRVVAAGLAKHPGQVVQFLIWDRDEPNRGDAVGRQVLRSDPTEQHRWSMSTPTPGNISTRPISGAG